MRKGQVTIFIILGIVIVIAVAIMFFAVRNLNTVSTQPQPDTDELLVKTCLAKTTEDALEALATGGTITAAELGPEQLGGYVDGSAHTTAHVYTI